MLRARDISKSSLKSNSDRSQSTVISLGGDISDQFHYFPFICKSAKLFCTNPTYKTQHSVQHYKSMWISNKITDSVFHLCY